MISVCIATYNGESFIEDQLKSILSQLSEDDEILISDDGSADNTVAKINAFCDSRIKWAGLGGNLGIVKNFERTLFLAKGDLVFLSDQDDIWLPEKVLRYKEALKDSILVVSDCRVVDKELNEIHSSFFRVNKSGSGFIRNFIKNGYLGCCMAFRRELLSYALPMPVNIPMHDIWLGLIAETQGRVTFLPTPYLLYRRHGLNTSPASEKSKFSLYTKTKYRLVVLWLLINRILTIYINKNFF